MNGNGGNYRFTQTGGPPQDFNQSSGVAQWRADNAARRLAQAQANQYQANATEPARPFNPVEPTQINYAYELYDSETQARNRAILKAAAVGVAVRLWQHYRAHRKASQPTSRWHLPPLE